MPVTPDEFRSALSRFPSGITVVTSIDASGGLHGITVSAFSSVSLNPPLVLVCIEKTTGSHQALLETSAFVVNILGEGQEELSERFSLQMGDKFASVSLAAREGGIPILGEALAVLECRMVNAYDGGDHTIFVGRVETTSVSDGEPLVYFHGNYRSLLSD